MKLRPPPPRRRLEGYHPPLQVSRFVATNAGDPERGPKVWMRAAEAKVRLLQDGELVWVFGPHRHDLAELAIDETVPRGQLFARDVAGVAPAEIVYVVKPDLDTPERAEHV